jgi:heme/copper-type cytochrome/quinol oxidase subunit 2
MMNMFPGREAPHVLTVTEFADAMPEFEAKMSPEDLVRFRAEYDVPRREEYYIEFDSYMRQEEDLSNENLRLLEVDRALLLPVHASIRLNFTGVDVIHS